VKRRTQLILRALRDLRAIVLLPTFCLWASAEDIPRVKTFVLPRTNLSEAGNPAVSAEALARAKANGLEFTDMPSIGSGLARAGDQEFWGITDRGPNGKTGGDDDATRRTFPLPGFCPAIVRFRLADGQIRITQWIPLADSRGKLISGFSNGESEERLYESSSAKTPLPFDPNGVDPEGIRVLPDGNFLVCEEYSPSILVVATNGQVLVRYTPRSKPLAGATYPVKSILPDSFAGRRVNKGFESVAISGDGRFAYAILQSPRGDTGKKRYAESRVIRVLKLDLSRPLDATVAGEYLALTSPAAEYPDKQKQHKVSWNDADWVAPDQLLVVENGKGRSKLLLVDLRRATNVLERKEEPGLTFESTAPDLAVLGVQPASAHVVFSTKDAPEIASDKIEGIAVLSPTEVALAFDNDFGMGEKAIGQASKVWIVRLTAPLR
jgi:alkaline phosphatase